MAEEAILRNFELVYALLRAPMAASVLHLGAHPDDEDAGMLALVSRGQGARAVYWSATRGEGAQNYVGAEKNELLGIVRTWESLAARAYDGGEVLYGPFIDFGFTKTGELALAKWGHEATLREVVRVIRLVQPTVVVNRWSGYPEDGHGHHQAVGLISEEAFDAAADPQRFPELGLPAWSVLKLYHSMGGDWQPGEDVTLGALNSDYEDRNLLRLDTGALDPISGNTFQQLAWRGYNRHQSQGMGFVPGQGDYCYYYALDRARVPGGTSRENSFFDGLDPSLSGLASWPELPGSVVADQLSVAAAAARSASGGFHPTDPTRAAPALIEALAALRDALVVLSRSREPGAEALVKVLMRKEREIESAVTRCLGLDLQADLSMRLVNPGAGFGVAVKLQNKSAVELDELKLAVDAPSGWATSAAPGGPAPSSTDEYQVSVPVGAEFTCPYWLRNPHGPYRYDWPDSRLACLPLDPADVIGTASFSYRGQHLGMEAPALSREAFEGGYRELSLSVLPPIALAPERVSEFLPIGASPAEIQLRLTVRCNKEGGEKGELELAVPERWGVTPRRLDVEFQALGESHTATFDLRIPATVEPGHYQLDYRVQTGDLRYGATLHPVRSAAPGLPRPADEHTCVREVFITEPAVVNIHLVNVDFVRKLKYGYVNGAGDGVLSTLRHFELDLGELDDDYLQFGDLSLFDAIVVGPNAYLVRDALRTHGARLLEYARAGGTVIVQYQGYAFQSLGFVPYPFRYHQPHDRVTFEDASITVLQPDHALLRVPNEITELDWAGWVNDRGMYFFGEYDDKYTPILECNDPNEPPQRGGLLVAEVGQGNWVYCAYSLWKQIPAGVPGGFRLFANLLGLPHARILERAHLLLGSTLFASMTEDQRYDIARLMSDRRLDDGELLCRQGEAGDEMYVIVEGEIEVLKSTPAHPDDTTVAVAGAGEAVGELSVLASQPRSATMRARGQVRLLEIWGPAFRELVHTNPDIADHLIQTLVDKLATTPVQS